jgi:hypothetical protein
VWKIDVEQKRGSELRPQTTAVLQTPPLKYNFFDSAANSFVIYLFPLVFTSSPHSHFRAEILDGDKSLVIKNVLPGDEGTYICEAHNSVGQISSKAQLIVNCKYIFSITHPRSSLIDGRAWQNLLLVMFQQ